MIEKRNVQNLKSGIYKIKFVDTDYFYIGSAVNLSNRKSAHLHNLINNKHCNKIMQNIYNKHKSFEFIVLEKVDKNNLVLKEQFYIDTLKPNINILKVAKSSLGYKHSKENLIKIKDFNKKMSSSEDWLNKVNKTWFVNEQKHKFTKEQIKKRVEKYTGYKHTDETRIKMSEKAKNRDYSKIDFSNFIKSGVESTKKPVIQVNPITGEKYYFNSITDAILQFNTKQTRHLISAIKNNTLYKKFNWYFDIKPCKTP